MRAQDVMVKEVRTCGPDTDLQSLASTMWDCDCGVLPVVEQDGRLVGMVTDRDVAITAALRHKPLWELKASETFGGRQPATCREQDELDIVLDTMARNHVRRLPVVDDGGHVRGILSIDDLLARAHHDGGEAPSVDRVVDSLKSIVAEPVGRHGVGVTPAGPAPEHMPAVAESAEMLVSAVGSVMRAGAYLAVGVASSVAHAVGSIVRR